jgi:outer membrane lipoprotein carrier protein
MGFNGQVLQAMELIDNFGQRTVLRFSGMERNPKLPPGDFQFTPPKGADVITQ